MLRFFPHTILKGCHAELEHIIDRPVIFLLLISPCQYTCTVNQAPGQLRLYRHLSERMWSQVLHSLQSSPTCTLLISAPPLNKQDKTVA